MTSPAKRARSSTLKKGPATRSSERSFPSSPHSNLSLAQAAAVSPSLTHGASQSATVHNLIHAFESVSRNLYQEKFVDSQLSIQQWQHYIIGMAVLDINLGKTNKLDANMQLLATAYAKQAEGQAEGIWKFMLHPKGGGKDARWTNGRDVDYLRKRLMHKDKECRNEVDGKYLWNQ